MAVPLEVREIAEGDYSPAFGTVRKVVEHKDRTTNELESVDLTFWNGTEQLGLSPDTVLDIVQGGLAGYTPSQHIRPGLASDHPEA